VDAGLRRHTASAPTASNTANKMTVLRVMGLKTKGAPGFSGRPLSGKCQRTFSDC